MKNYKFLSVIMVIALCFGAAQSVDAKKKKKHRRTHKTEKIQPTKEQVKEGERAIGAKDDDAPIVDDVLAPALQKSIEPKPMPKQRDDEVLWGSVTKPMFPGGQQALMNFIAQNLQYPEEGQDNGIQGKVVVQFVIEKDGRVGEVRVARGVYPDLDREAVRVCKMLPKFSPGRDHNGNPVRVWHTLPIIFKLQGAHTDDGPTGNYEVDAKKAAIELINLMNNADLSGIKSAEDFEKWEKEFTKQLEDIQKKYEDFYKARGEEKLEKFSAALNALENDPEISKRLDEAQRNLEEKAAKLMEFK
ncbi:MAG: energy transducer TonB [Muribaculaceae bacterium]|nr:energy transducer TonB [Muribaculaceae bacterium]